MPSRQRQRQIARRAWVVVGLGLLRLLPAARAVEPPLPPVDFARDIQPIFAAHCLECHGAQRQEGGLRLTSRESALAGGDSGQKAVVPSDPEKSRLITAISGADADLNMPPEGEGRPLGAEQVALLTRWVSEGAVWPAAAEIAPDRPAHWAWQKPVQAALPEVRRSDWPRRPLDYFVLQRIEREGFQPAAEATRHALVRRVHLDLIGLPPTIEQVEAFVADTRLDAYERMVDRVLADPGYGERWARVWLDLARYADSKGYGSDPLRTIWRYRDWVIDAFNRNQAFDSFTIEQLAGDLLPGATPEQVLATAFHRNTMANDEGGTDDEEFRVAAIKDRIETTMQVWMGLTMGCAKCHSHKFDPITQREYYQAYAFFNQTEDADRGDETPRVPTPTQDQRRQIAQRREARSQLEQQLLAPPAGIEPQVAEWEAALAAAEKQSPGSALPQPVRDLLATPAEHRTLRERAELARSYWSQSAATQALRTQLARLEEEIQSLEQQAPLTPIMRELPPDKQRVTHTMIKGNYLVPGDVVPPALPAAFHPLPAGAPINRLGLAQWIVDRQNPLTARVMVNRLWAQIFGTGLVATEEDFGTQGLPPTHPELLDWLAVSFRDGGWDIKQLLREIVTSATYRQSSIASEEVVQKDPKNHWLARGPRLRLEAEMVRDQALAIAGLLCRQQGGPSVFPPQPDGLWRAAFNSERTWATSAGGDRYRRGLYTYWRRSVPYPSMAVFDAPSREICALRRIATNTPLQAFVVLNDPVYVEAAQALARRIVAEGGTSPQDRCAFALRLALSRPASAEQVAPLASLFQSELAHYQRNAEAALQMASQPLGPIPPGQNAAELAAWTVVSNVVLNLDGVLTKR